MIKFLLKKNHCSILKSFCNMQNDNGTKNKHQIFVTKFSITKTGILKMLQEVYGDFSKSRTTVFEWHKKFVEGRENMENDPKSGRLSTSQTNTNIKTGKS